MSSKPQRDENRAGAGSAVGDLAQVKAGIDLTAIDLTAIDITAIDLTAIDIVPRNNPSVRIRARDCLRVRVRACVPVRVTAVVVVTHTFNYTPGFEAVLIHRLTIAITSGLLPSHSGLILI